MSKTHMPILDDSCDSGISTEKENEEASSSHELHSPKELSLYRSHTSKTGYKSLTVLNAKDSSESLQKVQRRGEGSRRAYLRSFGERRSRKKGYRRKRIDKSNVSELNIRRVTDEIVVDEVDRLVSLVNPRKIAGKISQSDSAIESSIETDQFEDISGLSSESLDISECFEQLRLSEEDELPKSEQEVNAAIELGSGDVHQDLPNFDLVSSEDMCCASAFDPKKRVVQWRREVDVIYYAGDADGGKILHRKNEPLREEAEQQARRNRFMQLALVGSN